MSAKPAAKYPVTPDGRYFVVGKTLWRCSNPALATDVGERLVRRLMTARRAVGVALKTKNAAALAKARRAVDRAKRQLGERGAPWWTDGAPDFNRHHAINTPYAAWFTELPAATKKQSNRRKTASGKRSPMRP